MSFTTEDIRTSMDVYTLDNYYLGSILRIKRGRTNPPRARVPETARQSSETNGEMLGPMPTASIGNPGPRNQSAQREYATTPSTDRSIGDGSLTVGKWWGLVDRRHVPIDAILSVSLERIVLSWKKDDLR